MIQKLSYMIISLFLLLARAVEVLALKIMRISSSRITKKNQFIERIVGVALK